MGDVGAATINIYAPSEFPYGLLSAKANFQQVIDGEHWNTVSEYVYVRLFDDARYVQRMRKGAWFNTPYSYSFRTCLDLFAEDVGERVRRGTIERIGANASLLKRLFATFNRTLVVETKSPQKAAITAALEYWRGRAAERAAAAAFVDERGVPIDDEAVVAFIVGLRRLVNARPDFTPDDVTYDALRRYSDTSNVTTTTFEEDDMLESCDRDLSRLFAIVKLDARRRDYASRRASFKRDLFDAQLDRILATDYVDVDASDYELAKLQQRQKLTDGELMTLVDQLMAVYDAGDIDPLVLTSMPTLLNRLDYERSVESDEREALDAIRQRSLSAVGSVVVEPLVVGDDDELMPWYVAAARPFVSHDGLEWSSVMHWATSSIFQFLHVARPTSLDDASLAPDSDGAKELRSAVNEAHSRTMAARIVQRFNKATRLKLQGDAALRHLLARTGNAQLVWGDCDDAVLGGERNQGGLTLKRIRSELMKPESAAARSLLPLSVHALIGDATVTSVTILWLFDIANDLFRVVRLLRDASITDLKRIYGAAAASAPLFRIPTRGERTVMSTIGFNDHSEFITWPFVLTALASVANVASIDDAVDQLVAARSDAIDAAAAPSTDEETERAERYLREAYDELRTKIYVKRDDFVMAVLSNASPVGLDRSAYRRWRVRYWSQQRQPH